MAYQTQQIPERYQSTNYPQNRVMSFVLHAFFKNLTVKRRYYGRRFG